MRRVSGDVHPSEYNWKRYFDIGLMGYVSIDVGKVRGLAQYAEELDARVAELENRIANAPERAVFLKHDVDIGDALDKYVVSLNRWGTLDNNPNAVLANEDALLRTVVRAALQEGE